MINFAEPAGGLDSSTRLMLSDTSDLKDVSFAISAQNEDGWKWSKKVAYGEELSVKVPTGKVTFAMRLILADFSETQSLNAELTEVSASSDHKCGLGDPGIVVYDAGWAGKVKSGENTIPVTLSARKRVELLPLSVLVRDTKGRPIPGLELTFFDGLTKQPIVDPCAGEAKSLVTDADGMVLSSLPDLGSKVPLDVQISNRTLSAKHSVDALKFDNDGYLVSLDIESAKEPGELNKVAVSLDTADIDGNGITDKKERKSFASLMQSKGRVIKSLKGLKLQGFVTKENLVCVLSGLDPVIKRSQNIAMFIADTAEGKQIKLLGNANDGSGLVKKTALDLKKSYQCKATIGDLRLAAPLWDAKSGGTQGQSGSSIDNQASLELLGDVSVTETYDYEKSIISLKCQYGGQNAGSQGLEFYGGVFDGEKIVAEDKELQKGSYSKTFSIPLQSGVLHRLRCGVWSNADPQRNAAKFSAPLVRVVPQVLFSRNGGVAALKRNGSVVTFGDPLSGGASISNRIDPLIEANIAAVKSQLGMHPDSDNNGIADVLQGNFASNGIYVV